MDNLYDVGKISFPSLKDQQPPLTLMYLNMYTLKFRSYTKALYHTAHSITITALGSNGKGIIRANTGSSTGMGWMWKKVKIHMHLK